MFCWIGKVVVVNNNGIIHFGFVKQIAPESIQVGSGNGATTSEEALEETGRETENQANGNGNGASANGKIAGKNTSRNSKSRSKSKGKATGKAPATAKKTAALAASNLPNPPYGNSGKTHPLGALLKKGFK
ncbi:hypothetical protein M3194_04430 [Paenibacillus glycanilyticus]|uniref:hypothetical protein n=1 Tax=Paenibacillus glycanilyticus TaxID=126569 RepID=UPI00203B99B3|nr:hypothetical protein [Paenibacillus glycanilyticus]MCM3626611.1 hypothetical protein [Paenibacillus glycanilyticus]